MTSGEEARSVCKMPFLPVGGGQQNVLRGDGAGVKDPCAVSIPGAAAELFPPDMQKGVAGMPIEPGAGEAAGMRRTDGIL